MERHEHHAGHAAATHWLAYGLPCPGARIVYVETAWRELLCRNRVRSAPVPEAVLQRLAEKLEVPDLTEGHDLEYEVT